MVDYYVLDKVLDRIKEIIGVTCNEKIMLEKILVSEKKIK